MLNIERHVETVKFTLSELKAYMVATGDIHGYQQDLSELTKRLTALKDELEKEK